MVKEKKCKRCGEIKKLTEYNFIKKTNVYHSWCRPCHNLTGKIYHRKNKYGLNEIDISKLLKKQKNKCAICQKNILQKFHVDHNHETKKVRGLLCHNCNLGLGNFADRIDLLSRAVVFLYERGSYGFKYQKNN